MTTVIQEVNDEDGSNTNSQSIFTKTSLQHLSGPLAEASPAQHQPRLSGTDLNPANTTNPLSNSQRSSQPAATVAAINSLLNSAETEDKDKRTNDPGQALQEAILAEQETFFDNYFASEGLVPAEPSRRGQALAPQSFHAKHRCSHIEGFDSPEQCASLRASQGGEGGEGGAGAIEMPLPVPKPHKRLHFAEGRPRAEHVGSSGGD